MYETEEDNVRDGGGQCTRRMRTMYEKDEDNSRSILIVTRFSVRREKPARVSTGCGRCVYYWRCCGSLRFKSPMPRPTFTHVSVTREGEAGSEAVRSILDSTLSSPHCTHVFLTDSSSTTILEGGWSDRSLVLLQASNTSLSRLSTTVAKVRQVRMLVWETRLLLVTRLPRATVDSLLISHWTFTMMNTILANLDPQQHGHVGTLMANSDPQQHGHVGSLMANSDPQQHGHVCVCRWQVFVHLPYSPVGPKVVRVASWTHNEGLTFHSNTQLFPNKFSNFHGATVPLTALILPPFWKVVNPKARDSWTKYSGRDCLLTKFVARALNFTFHMHRSSNIDEIMVSLETTRVMLSVFRIMLIPQILARVDHSYFIDRASFTFSMTRPSTKPQWQSLFYPLALEVWFGILALVFIVPPITYMILYLEGTTYTRAALQNTSPTMETIAILLGQDVLFRLPKGDSSRILICVWLLFSFWMGTVYRGTLTAFLTVPDYPSRPENMEELAQAGVRCKFTQNATRFLMYFQESNLTPYRSVASRVDIVSTVLEGLQETSENNVAFFHERYNTQLMIAKLFNNRDGTSNLYVAKENVIPNYAAWMMPHDAPYKTEVDSSLLRVIESGLKEKFTEDMMSESWREIRHQKQKLQQEEAAEGHNNKQEEQEEEGEAITSDTDGLLKPLSITHLQGGLWVVVFGLALSVVAFFVEKLGVCFRSTDPKNT
ncbi:hypothetical protein Pmani_027012 [Petrolisthes manimaculis]|uniref:Ionotropic glutamate receptor C-terminal domain-containing protein n=1 Tax=Petrolisthes manimaculis TaxID=1843537 RepID=A0AAE1P2C2_9EUCA|nr:hypothetical protein Pmani_027012 [Petrolisthes manimaculis]